MANIKSLLGKILIPVAIAYCIAAIITLNIVSQSVTRLTTEVLTARSEAASYSVGENFTKYMEIAKQMAADSSFEELFLKTQPGMAMTSVEEFPQIKKTMDNVQKTDPSTITVSWISDIDSSQFRKRKISA